MKKLLAVLVLLAVGFAFGVSWKELIAHAAGGGGTPSGNGDVNGDGTIDISDAVYLLDHLFMGGPALVPIKCKPDAIEGFTSLGENAQGYPVYRHDQTGIIFVRLPGGWFSMGSPEWETGHTTAEGPVHSVYLSPFLIAKYELTQAQWTAVMGSNPSSFKGDVSRPVENVSWDDIQDFETKTGLTLPTEAQWEYACRAGTEGPYAGTGSLDDMGWYDKNSGSTTHPFGQKQPNGFGLYDMHGNVWEWCEDVLDASFYSKPAAVDPDPVSTSGSGLRVLRGGSWRVVAISCRSSVRGASIPSYRGGELGFRPSRPAP